MTLRLDHHVFERVVRQAKLLHLPTHQTVAMLVEDGLAEWESEGKAPEPENQLKLGFA